MEYVFWVCILLLAHTYLLYPLSLSLFSLASARPRRRAPTPPRRVTLIIAAYNEEDIIEEKIRNCLELDYPQEKLEILIGSDASSDATNEIVSRYAPRVRLVEFLDRGGKASVLNGLVPLASGEILVFCDANTMLLRNALRKLVAAFDDPSTGIVCGRLVLHDAGTSSLGIGETVYWNLESEIKRMEGQLGIVMGANGGLYALRRELYAPIPADRTAMDDFYVTMQVLKSGWKAVFEPQAIGSEETSAGAYGEFHRKVRIGQANFNLLPQYLALLNPRRGLVAYGFLSHKLLRWLGPLILLMALCSNALVWSEGLFYQLTMLLQVAFYALGMLGYTQNRGRRKSGLLLLPFYFLSMNAALLLGMFRSYFGGRGGMWNRIERARMTSRAEISEKTTTRELP